MQDFENKLNKIIAAISKLIQQWKSLNDDGYKLFKSLSDIRLQMNKLKLMEDDENFDKELIENELLIKSEEILRKSEFISIIIYKSENILENIRQNQKKILALSELSEEFLKSFNRSSSNFFLFLNQTIEQLSQLIYMLEKECLFHSSALWDFATNDNNDLNKFLCIAWENQIYLDNYILSQFLN
ncbi:hypothetical protein ACQ4LE_003372 [Meloidogyne hapla]|uniref:Uncharacterized protein n=1 Tax=Meloidogyne hapla TaxID=6305 RepID=A0A1I8BWS8_MELHA